MTHTSYKELADALFNKIKDYSFLKMDITSAYEIVINYIRSACVKFENCKQNLSDRDNELEEFNFKLTDDTFEILVNYMVIEWLTSNYILTGQTLKARMSTTDFHKYDNKDMLSKCIELKNNLMAENKQIEINKSYKKSKLYDIATNKKRMQK